MGPFFSIFILPKMSLWNKLSLNQLKSLVANLTNVVRIREQQEQASQLQPQNPLQLEPGSICVFFLKFCCHVAFSNRFFSSQFNRFFKNEYQVATFY